MKALWAFLWIVLLQYAPGLASETEVSGSPVRKVLELLNGMLAKGKAEKHKEQVEFASYKQFCDDTSVEKKRSISDAEDSVDVMKADIQKYKAKAEFLTKEMSDIDEDVAGWEGNKKAATKLRVTQKTAYGKTHKDYSESVDALRRAIAVLKKQNFDRKQKSSLLQIASLRHLAALPDDAKSRIEGFIQRSQALEAAEGSVSGAPQSNAYEFQSIAIIEMLEKLLDKFSDERTKLEQEEANSRNAYQLLMQSLKAQIDQATKDRASKIVIKAKTLQASTETAGDLDDVVEEMQKDKKYLAGLTGTCQQKAQDYETRQKIRAEEVIAIEKAIEIISSDTVAGKSKKFFLLAQSSPADAYPQLRAEVVTPVQARVADYLRNRASQLNSRILSTLALRVVADPFTKVKKMIKDLVVRLMEEANEESEHKGWCDKELSTNEQTRKWKSDGVETLHAEIDELSASIEKLVDSVGDMTEAVAKIDAAVSKATKLRQEEKATNTETISDATNAQEAVARAMTVLKSYYAKAGESTALMQDSEGFDSPYKGMQAENGGVIGMLEVIESDFARLEADTRAAEVTAQKQYDKFTSESKVDKAGKTSAIDHMESKKQDQSQELVEKKQDLESTQKELDAALAYYDKLRPSCVDSGVSYEDRVARRQSEIASLQDALRILSGEDIS